MGHGALSSSKLRFRCGLVSSLFDLVVSNFVDTNYCKLKVPHAMLKNKLLVPHAMLKENVGNTTLQTQLSKIVGRRHGLEVSLFTYH